MEKNTAVVKTFEKGLQLLEFVIEHKIVTVTSISKMMGIPKSAGYRFLYTLRLQGYVEQDKQNNYILTDKIKKIGEGIVPRLEFRRIVLLFLDELAKKNSKEYIFNLGKWHKNKIFYEAQSTNFEYAQYSIGRSVPAYCSALGKAILAYLPERELNNYILQTNMESFTEKTCTTESRLRQELIKVREKGFATMDGELCLPLKGLAVPLIPEKGRVQYAISCTRTLYGSIDTLIDEILDQLQETAQAIITYMKKYNLR